MPTMVPFNVPHTSVSFLFPGQANRFRVLGSLHVFFPLLGKLLTHSA